MRLLRVFFVAIFLFFSISAYPSQSLLQKNDISRIMDRFFSLHIENKNLNPTIVRRCFKLFIEHFDPEKNYLLENEVVYFLQMSDETASAVANRMNHEDYSDFWKLNESFQKAITRSRQIRSSISLDVYRKEKDLHVVPISLSPQYARTEEELALRQRSRMIRFYQFHQSRSDLSTLQRKEKLLSLFDRKVRRYENNYLFLNFDGTPMSSPTAEHQMSVRILKAFAKSLDTHSSFFSPEEAQEMRLSLEKQFEGVGVVLFEGVDGVMISEVVKGSPADLSGEVQVNDLLVEIDGVPLGTASFEEVLELLKNDTHKQVVLGFRRQSHFFRISLQKQPIAMNESMLTASYEKFGNGIIGKISLYSFYESSDGQSSEKDIKKAIRSFQKEGDLYGLILDLRENSGGFLSQAVKVSGLFLSNGVVVISKYGQGEVHYLRNIVGRSFFNGPLVVLISKMSASASEIVAQALQDYGVGVIVGDERTFGKGSIQYQTVTDENADLFFKVTVGKYYTASGRTPQIGGVKTDISVATHYAPYNIGERFLDYPLPADQLEPAFIDPLSDLDAKAKRLFISKYLPYLQRVVLFWKKMLPILQKNSQERLKKNTQYQAMLRYHEKIRPRIESLPPNLIDEKPSLDADIQMAEAVHIIEDMILLEQQARPSAAADSWRATGSDG
jgi:carboxyl-terminal processing protease